MSDEDPTRMLATCPQQVVCVVDFEERHDARTNGLAPGIRTPRIHHSCAIWDSCDASLQRSFVGTHRLVVPMPHCSYGPL